MITHIIVWIEIEHIIHLSGLSVTGIAISEENLEEYFSNLIGGGGIA